MLMFDARKCREHDQVGSEGRKAVKVLNEKGF